MINAIKIKLKHREQLKEQNYQNSPIHHQHNNDQNDLTTK